MEQWGFALTAFGITLVTLAIYALVLRSRTRAEEAEQASRHDDYDK